MIRRNYFFLASHTDEKERASAHGLVTLRSWRADPLRAMNTALDRVSLDYAWPREQVLVERFARC